MCVASKRCTIAGIAYSDALLCTRLGKLRPQRTMLLRQVFLPRPAAHLRSLFLPGMACGFLAVWPANPWVALAWGLSPFLVTFPGDSGRDGSVSPSAKGRLWPTLLLLTLGGLHTANLILAIFRISGELVPAPQALAGMVLLSVSSVVAAAVTGHELIHSRQPLLVWAGRWLLASILYEHFHTEHLYGHHAKYATEADPATARYGESFGRYLRRTVPAQWQSAWALEATRLRDQGLGPWRHRLLQGLLMEALIAAGAWSAGGAVGLAVFVTQSAVVQVVFSAVQYFQHWGLRRLPGRELPHSWDGQDRVSFVNLLGLSRHADHHAHPDRPFEHMELTELSPRLPYPYSVMVWLAVMRNARFQQLMTAELRRCGLLAERERAP